MKVTKTQLEGCIILEPEIYKDSRGIFFESYQKSKLDAYVGKPVDFVQDNISISKKGVLRGLHYQTGAHAQAKLVQVIEGEILDVVVDLRVQSRTYGQHLALKLSSKNKTLVFIPKGMAHGFLALSKNVIFSYKCDAYYHKESERGIIYNDPELNINWGKDTINPILSKKDLELPLWKDLKT
ncbi:dTDP-4-dehydrorhamnose 3,5-epimerase [Arenibacter sp. GZD96]|uniref:dTDP-4-dehydrorhamnose 3,5-epimerase n=1 Tax=Aurantibrevibacter litoralis TaxID=3106030 RepID=UPI002AFF70CF|nr:dTDP-4-dehydrorhamnose 3,5-epimerase [Arenibacter sp. GZD-96]MEA1786451.1 dTDP-4-dehydrorhamnose 3,5-epimerase [Arenibacter sp. GZD-96]